MRRSSILLRALVVANLLFFVQITSADTDITSSVTLIEDTSSSVTFAEGCPLFQLDIKMHPTKRHANGALIPGPTAMPSCLEESFDSAANKCRKKKWFDDCVAAYLIGNPSTRKDFGWGYSKSIYKPAVVRTVLDWWWKGMPTDATVYLDDQCNSITDLSDSQLNSVCGVGTYQWIFSPISLIWEEGYDIDEEFTLTQFPLDPGSDKAWYIWKASAKAPLLVYDPAHRGVITSASELFGQWTFGGRSLSMLGSSPQIGQADTRWENGYEALAVLDRDGNKELRGEELKDLALWFDVNRNGISEPGEVKRLAEVGVSVIYTTPDKHDNITNSISATKGFKREIDGDIVVGSSVDWFADSASTPLGLVASHLVPNDGCGLQAGLSQISPVAASSPPQIEDTPQIDIPLKSVRGAWDWNFADGQVLSKSGEGDAIAPRGFFTFDDPNDGTITGRSYTEMPLEEGKSLGKIKAVLGIVRFEGKKTLDEDGVVHLSFTLLTKQGTKISNKATLSYDGSKLNGQSEAKFVQDGKPMSAIYNWVAKRKN